MYNPYQAQGNALNQQQTGFYSQPGQQPPPVNRQTTTEFGNLQQNVPASFGNQQQNQGFTNTNPLQNQQTSFGQGGFGQFSPQQGSYGVGGPSQIQSPAGFPSNQLQQSGYASSGTQAQQSGYQQSGSIQGLQQQPQQTGFVSQQPNQSLQAQQTGYFSQQPQPPQTSFYSQVQPQQSLQPQQTGRFNQQELQQPQQTLQPQSTGFFSQQQPQQQPQQPQQQQQQQQQQQPQQSMQPMQPMQPQQTGFYSQQPPQPLQPQQTGFYSQQQSAPLQPLKPTATGFVNSFTNNGINNTLKIPNMRLSFVTAQDQAKFETLFRSVVPQGSNTISGENCRSILMKSGLAPSQLARIWTLCDTSKAGELLFPEFALAMNLINNVLQGDSIPFELDTKTKNEVSSFVDAINFSIAGEGESSEPSKPKTPFDDLTAGIPTLQSQPTGFMPQTSFGMPLQSQFTGGALNQQSTGYMPQTSFNQPLNSQLTGGILQSQLTGGFLQSQSTGGPLQPQSTGFMPQTSFNQPLQGQLTGGGFQPSTSFSQPLQGQATGSGMQPQVSFNQPLQSQITGGGLQSQVTAGFPSYTSVLQNQQNGGIQLNSQSSPFPLQSQPTGFLPPSNFNPTAPLTAQKTGFGNNEIYSQSNFANKFTADNSDFITAEEKSLFYRIFETYDTQNKGLMDSQTAVEIFRKSGLNRADLEQIWNLCDTNNNGQLNKQEFALGMHLVYRRLNGHSLPPRLPPSLIPSSNRILDSVKEQLKNSDSNENKKLPTKADGLKFRNNDDELLPSSRNRRKTFVDAKEIEGNKETISNLKKLISEKQVKLDMETRHSDHHYPHENAQVDDAKAIEDLKKKILSSPRRSPSNANGVPSQLRTKFDALTSRVPELLAEISKVDDEITNAKVELYRLRNPSSLVGSGPNGEITEQDRKKAKSKALLASRMAALTGKPVGSSSDLEQEEEKFNAEVVHIKNEHSNNQAIINDIQTSIAEIAASVHWSLNGRSSNDNTEDYQKWELGIGVEPEVSRFIRELKAASSTKTYTSDDYSARNPSYVSYPTAETAQQRPSLSKSESSSYSNLSGGEDRASYLKEQAQRKMNEKLAKLGLGKNEASIKPTPAQPINSEQASSRLQNELNVRSEQNGESSSTGHVQGHEETDEDEEVRRLMQQLEHLKAKKKAEREEKLVKLRKDVEHAKNGNENEDSWDEESEPIQKPSSAKPAEAPVLNASIAPVPTSQYESLASSSTPSSAETPQSNASHHEHNPFSRNTTQQNASTPGLVSTSTGGRNPFFKQATSTTSSFDAKAAEAQRRLQRGLDDDDDDWSDDNDHSKQNVVTPVDALSTAGNNESQLNLVDQSKMSLPSQNDNVVPRDSVAVVAPKVEDASIPPVPVAPPLPNVDPVPVAPVPVAPSIPPVPVAPPLPNVNPVSTAPVPLAPPLPQINASLSAATSTAPPLQVELSNSQQDPVAPPPLAQATEQPELVPSIASHILYENVDAPAVQNSLTTAAQAQDDEGYVSDDLSIPDSVASDDDDDDFKTPALEAPLATAPQVPPSGIPPPPPLP